MLTNEMVFYFIRIIVPLAFHFRWSEFPILSNQNIEALIVENANEHITDNGINGEDTSFFKNIR